MDIGLLVLRLGFGLAFIWFHGWDKITAGPERWEMLGGNMANYGITFWPSLWGFLASIAESVAAVLIAVGFLFRPASFLLAFTMLTASIFHIVSGQGSPAHSIKNLFVAAGVGIAGPGRYSVDAWIASSRAKRTQGANM
jgi:putative oxidoreductase